MSDPQVDLSQVRRRVADAEQNLKEVFDEWDLDYGLNMDLLILAYKRMGRAKAELDDLATRGWVLIKKVSR